MTGPALFEIDELTPPIFAPVAPGARSAGLTVYGAHHGLGPDVWADWPICGAAHYGSAVDADGRQVWIWHACPISGEHDEHRCDRCAHTWAVS